MYSMTLRSKWTLCTGLLKLIRAGREGVRIQVHTDHPGGGVDVMGGHTGSWLHSSVSLPRTLNGAPETNFACGDFYSMDTEALLFPSMEADSPHHLCQARPCDIPGHECDHSVLGQWRL